MRATLRQLATYIERDGATVRYHADGGQTVSSSSPLLSVSWFVPSYDVDELNRERDSVYRIVAARRRKDLDRAR